jgi:hypothetical protein
MAAASAARSRADLRHSRSVTRHSRQHATCVLPPMFALPLAPVDAVQPIRQEARSHAPHRPSAAPARVNARPRRLVPVAGASRAREGSAAPRVGPAVRLSRPPRAACSLKRVSTARRQRDAAPPAQAQAAAATATPIVRALNARVLGRRSAISRRTSVRRLMVVLATAGELGDRRPGRWPCSGARKRGERLPRLRSVG